MTSETKESAQVFRSRASGLAISFLSSVVVLQDSRMLANSFGALALLGLAARAQAWGEDIEHIIIFMQENRGK